MQQPNIITNYLYLAPEEAAYPFVTYFMVSCSTEYTFSHVIEDVNIQVSIYDNKRDVSDIIAIANDIETAFEEFNSNDGSNYIICTHKEQEGGPKYDNKEHYWTHIIEFNFKSQRSKTT